MRNKVVRLAATPTFTVEQALHDCLSENLDQVLIIGYDKEGYLFIRSSRMELKDALWMTRAAERYIFDSNGE